MTSMTRKSNNTTVVIAPTRDQGREFIRKIGAVFGELKGAHVVTPRSLDSIRGVTTIEKVVITEGMELSAEFLNTLARSLKIT